MLRLMAEEQAGLAEQIAEQRRALLTKIASNKKQLNNVVDAIAESGSSPALKTRLSNLELEKLDLDLALTELESAAALESSSQAPTLSTAQLDNALKDIVSILKSKEPHALKLFLRGFIDHIDVERNENTLRGTIYYTLPGDGTISGNNTIPPSSGDDDVPTSSHPSGPPLRRHIMQYHFVASTKRPRP